jgi:hypothetical protein
MPPRSIMADIIFGLNLLNNVGINMLCSKQTYTWLNKSTFFHKHNCVGKKDGMQKILTVEPVRALDGKTYLVNIMATKDLSATCWHPRDSQQSNTFDYETMQQATI